MSGNIVKGTEITCPKCHQVMVRCIETPTIGMVNWARCFENVKWTGGVGSLALCNECGATFARWSLGTGHQLHVEGIGFTT
jgi:hypothetical protein